MSAPLILVVEDEPLVRLHAVSLLEAAGFDTLEAGSADQALVLLEAHDDIRIVFTDINLPGSMDGLRLSQAVRQRWPAIELILTSGRARLRDEDLPWGGVFLDKPYRGPELIETIRSLMP